MKSFLAIDPGKNCTGWAYFEGRKLVDCGMSVRTPKQRTLGDISKNHADVVSDLVAPPDVVCVELMQSYAFDSQKGDQNDLIALATIGGQIAGRFPHARSVYVTPATWKGQVPKHIMARRIERGLVERECLHALRLDRYAASLRHNVLDAVGIGLYITNLEAAA